MRIARVIGLVVALAAAFGASSAVEGHGGGGHGGGGHGGSYGGSGYHGGTTPSMHGTPHSYAAPSHSSLAGHPANHWGPHSHHPDWYHGHWHDHGHYYPWHHWPAGWWGAGFLDGLAVGALLTPWAWGYWPYCNPYCDGPCVIEGAAVDYAQPLVLAGAPGAPGAATPATASAGDRAMDLLDGAHDAFVQGNYTAALAWGDKAVAALPGGAAPHEFRAQALFAQGRYREAAAPLYAVLSMGPGWDWETLSGLYPDVNVYAAQLRALEQYINAHPNSAEARFVLAYEYMSCGHAGDAADQFKAAAQLSPKDQLSAQLAMALVSTDPAVPPPPAAAPAPVAPRALVGQWRVARSGNDGIDLNLADDGTYTWKTTQNGRSREFRGNYSVADNLLVLKQNNAPMMAGQVAMPAADRFNFKLAGDNPSDPGLTFTR